MLTVIALVEDLFGVGVEVVAWARSAKALWILPVGQAAESASGFTRGPEAQPSTMSFQQHAPGAARGSLSDL
jgi:hypothetical protein